MDWSGIILGASAFLIIGLFHPIVIKVEYYWGKGFWWLFAVVGLGFCIASLLSHGVLSAILGVLGFSCFWSILELFAQEKRVAKGWFPSNPRKKKTLTILLFVFCSVSLSAQDGKESIAYLNGGAYLGSHNNIGAYMGLEYDRQLNGNWFWGARLSGTYYLGSPMKYDAVPGQNPYRNTIDQNIYKADAMIYYRFPVIKDIVKLRAGAGFGLGYHDIFDRKYDEKDKVIPYLNASLNWLIKCGKHLEFALSPAIFICPSEFDYSFVQLGGETDINPWLTNYFGFSLGVGYRF